MLNFHILIKSIFTGIIFAIKKEVSNMTMEETDFRKKLLDQLARKSLKFGDFILTSGRKSNYYLNCKKVTRTAEGMFLLGNLLYNEIRKISGEIDGIGGMTMGADPICDAVSLISYMKDDTIESIIVRKERKAHGAQSLIEGNTENIKKIVVIDDVVTTGGSTIKAIEAFENETDFEIKGVFALVDRQEGGADNLAKKNYPYQPVFTKDEIIEYARSIGM